MTRVRPDKDGFRSPWIEGYCSKQSVKAGETIELMISTDPPRRFQIEIFRMGYYGGRGARLMTDPRPVRGPRPDRTPKPGPKNLHECRWEPTTRLTIPDDWPSGVYLGRLTTLVDPNVEPYWQSYVVFIVRDERPADILFQCSDNTWQAYNRWPNNYSIYTHPKGNQGPWADVSFDRPYGREAQYDGVVNDPLTFGSGEFLPLEFPLAYWLEQHGYDVTYCVKQRHGQRRTGASSARHSSASATTSTGTSASSTASRPMRDAGVNLLFLSGNTMCWVTPFRASADGRPNRIMFRGGPYGGDNDYARQRQKEHGPFPEHGPDEGLLIGRPEHRTGQRRRRLDHPEAGPLDLRRDGRQARRSHPRPDRLGVPRRPAQARRPGESSPEARPGWEARLRNTGPRRSILDRKGIIVFNASTIFWAQGLSSPPGHTLPWSHWSRPHGPDERIQKITANLLNRAIGTAPGASRLPRSRPDDQLQIGKRLVRSTLVNGVERS